MTEKTRKLNKLAPIIRGVVSIALILGVILSMDSSELLDTLFSVSLTTVCALTLIDVVLRVLSAYRWQVLIAATSTATSLRDTTRITFTSSFLGQALPGVIGVEALRIFSLSKATGDTAGAFASVVADRVFGLASLAIVILVGLAIGPDDLQSLILKPLLFAVGLLVFGVLLVTVPTLRSSAQRIIPRVLLDRIQAWIDKVYECFDHYRSRPILIALSLLLATIFQFGRVLLFFAAALLIGGSADLIYFVAIVPIVMFAALLPISIAGLGVREAGLVYLLSAFSVMDSAPAFTISILVFVSGVLSTLPGAWFYTRDRKKLSEAMD